MIVERSISKIGYYRNFIIKGYVFFSFNKHKVKMSWSVRTSDCIAMYKK